MQSTTQTQPHLKTKSRVPNSKLKTSKVKYMPIRGLIQEGEGSSVVGSVSPWPNKCTHPLVPFDFLCKTYPHFLQRINGLASRVTDLECVPFHLDALNSLDLSEVVSDNEDKFLSVAACIQPHSPPWVSEVAWVASLNTGPLTMWVWNQEQDI
jgi:hypothetical protein